MCKSFCDHEAMTTMIKKKKKKTHMLGMVEGEILESYFLRYT